MGMRSWQAWPPFSASGSVVRFPPRRRPTFATHPGSSAGPFRLASFPRDTPPDHTGTGLAGLGLFCDIDLIEGVDHRASHRGRQQFGKLQGNRNRAAPVILHHYASVDRAGESVVLVSVEVEGFVILD